MSDSSIQKKTKKGLIHRSIESISMQITNFVVQMILARLLVPEDFGVVAILSTFTNIANTLVNNGLGSAIVQRKQSSQTDISTVFFVELGIGIFSYGAMFVAAPFIATAFDNPMIKVYLRVFALTQLFNPLSSIQLTVGKCRLDFKPSMIANLCAVAVQAVVGITMAMLGYGVWSLVISQVAQYVTRATMLCLLTRWMPTWSFSFQSFKSLFGYSWKLFAGWMIGTLYQDAFSWIIGQNYSDKTLGYYSKGHSIPAIVNKVATQVTSAVMFSSISKYQDDMKAVKAQTRSLISVSCALIFPIMAGLAACAGSLVHVVLTDKWAGAVPVIQIMCIPLALNVISNANMQPINAIGRSDLFLWLEMIKRGITIILVWILARIDFNLMLLSIAAGGILSLCVNTIYNRKLFDYRPHEYLLDIVPYAICAGILFGVVWSATLIISNMYLLMTVQLMLCAVVFGGFIFSGILPGYKSMRTTILGMVRKNNKKKEANSND